MPFPAKIQPIDSFRQNDIISKVPLQQQPLLLKSRLKRLFDRPFNMRISSVDSFEPSSVCLDKMVQNFIEDNNNNSNEKQLSTKLNLNRCNCFNGNSNDSSDDELDFFSDSFTANSPFGDPSDHTLKSLVPCVSVAERNLLADALMIVERNNRACKSTKDELRRIVADGLVALGYGASVCRSKWEKSSSIPAGEQHYIDVISEGERLIIDLDFRSEFEIARSTSSYKAILQCLPCIFVGKSDRLLQIVSIVSEAARLSLKKKGLHVPPWRKAEFMKSKWLSPHTRATQPKLAVDHKPKPKPKPEPEVMVVDTLKTECGELDLIFGDVDTLKTECGELDLIFGDVSTTSPGYNSPSLTWQLPAIKPKSLEKGNNKAVLTGLASLLQEKL